jgi:hypothetical protein
MSGGSMLRLPARPRSQRLVIALHLLLCSIVAGIVMVPGLLAGPSLDAAVFTLGADRLLDGVLPYSGTWDHKPPGIYVIGAIAQALLGWLGTWPAAWTLTVVAIGVCGALVATCVRRLDLHPFAAVAGIGTSVAMAQFVVSLGGGLTEPVAAAFATGAFLTALLPPRGRVWLLSGVLAGASVVVSIPALPVIAAVGVLVWNAGSGRALAAATLGGALVAATLAGLLVAAGVLVDAVDAVVVYNAAYRAASGPAAALGGPPQAAGVFLTFLFLIIPAGIGSLALRRRPQVRAVGEACLAWLAAAVALFIVQGRFETHYAIPLAVPLAMLAAMGLREATDDWRIGGARRAVIGVPIGLGVAISLIVMGTTAPAMVASVSAENGRANLVGRHVRAISSTQAAIFIWGNEPHIYLAAQRHPSSRYVYLYPLVTPGYSSASQIQTLLDRWRASPPVVIVDAGSFEPGLPGDPPLLIDRPVASDGRDLDLLDPLRRFVASHYELDAVVDGWPVYRYAGS